MDFLGVGPLELLFVLLIALLVVGPGDLVKVMHNIGTAFNRLRRSDLWQTASDIRQGLTTMPERLALEEEYRELRELGRDIGTSPREMNVRRRAEAGGDPWVQASRNVPLPPRQIPGTHHWSAEEPPEVQH